MNLRKKDFDCRCFQPVAFTLLEVMIAVAIFFMAMFSILALVSQCLRSAHALNQTGPTPGMVAAWFSQTNKLEEGFEDGDFEEIAAGLYPDYTWSAETLFYASNGMFQVDIGIYREGNRESAMSCLLYRPESPTGISTKSKFAR
ncbi:MAG: hypothetical protein ABIR24_05955 [Verrucomicrobiota bacterium]